MKNWLKLASNYDNSPQSAAWAGGSGSERQEAGGWRQEARGKRQEARGKRQEARGKRQKSRRPLAQLAISIGHFARSKLPLWLHFSIMILLLCPIVNHFGPGVWFCCAGSQAARFYAPAPFVAITGLRLACSLRPPPPGGPRAGVSIAAANEF